MKQILFVTARLPYPLDDGWKIRTFHMIKGWCQLGLTVDLLSFSFGEEDEYILNSLSVFCKNIYTVRRNKNYNFIDLLKGLITSKPFNVFNYFEREMFLKIKEIISKNNYYAVQVEDIVMAQYVINIFDIIKILDMHNVESNLLGRYANDTSNFFKKNYALMTSKKLINYEKKSCAKFEKIFVCSDDDKNILKRYKIRSSLHVFPNGVDCQYFNEASEVDTGKNIVFIGSMDYHANITGVLYFVREIIPFISSKIDDFKFFIVGKNPPKVIKNLASDHIFVTGTVLDIRPFLSMARVVVVPLLVGGGTRLKILEAMACGKAIVSTSIGAEGIVLRNMEHIILADDAKKFANFVLDLLTNNDFCVSLGRAARDLAREKYDWSVLTKQLKIHL